jgi:hypothetical protein
MVGALIYNYNLHVYKMHYCRRMKNIGSGKERIIYNAQRVVVP